ncbi:MAG: capsid protein [Cressdnaviricota sp.]|nr:MAG: capsid protein [Cressdnaviricota sp.]
MAYTMRSFKRSTRSRRPSMGRKRVGKKTTKYRSTAEKKYFDKTITGLSLEAPTGDVSPANPLSSGLMYVSNNWNTYSFNNQSAPSADTNNLLKGLITGTSARTRVGNKIRGKELRGVATFAAATTEVVAQNGEVPFDNSIGVGYYLRTTYRWCIIKDLQVNNADSAVTWNQVFENGTGSAAAGVHAELNVDNMGRFRILADNTFQLSAQNPQKSVQWSIPQGHIGSIQYNGDGIGALTNHGIHFIYAAFVYGNYAATSSTLPKVVMNSRLIFSDE